MSDASSRVKRGTMFWAGWILTLLTGLALIASAFMKFLDPLPPEALKGIEMLGLSQHLLRPIGTVELICAVFYLIPQTAVLGAILVTGYLGGAIATHVRADDVQNIAGPIIIGVLAWLGLFLRDPRVRGLIPWRNVK